MLKNYFTVALRAFAKQKVYAVINILGLSVGLAAALLIFLYLHSELTYDRQFERSEDTYILGVKFIDKEGNQYPNTYVPGGWTTYLKENLESVTGGIRTMWMGMPASIHYVPDDRMIMTEDILWVQSNFHEFMYFPVITGNREKALENPTGMAISKSSARDLFGDEDPIGKQVTLRHSFATNNQPLELTVSAVYEDYPQNIHIRPKYIVNYYALRPFQQFPPGVTFEQYEEHMYQGGYQSYILTKPDTDEETLLAGMNTMIDQVFADNPNLAEEFEGTVEPVVRNVQDIHFDKEYAWVTEGGGDITYIYTFASIALLIIIIACINYMNLATARSAKRSKEVGLRKSLGGERQQLVGQFMMESFLMVFLSFLIALLLVVVILPEFNGLASTSIPYSALFSTGILLSMFGLLLFVAFMSGIYPALFLSAMNTIDTLKGKFTFSKGSNILRKSLIGFQFVIAIILLISTVIAVNQMSMMQSSKLNEAGDQILSIRHGGTADYNKYATFKNMLKQDPDLQYVTFGNHLPRLDFFGPLGVPYKFPDVTDEEYEWNTFNVDYDFIKTYGLELIEGRDFQIGNTSDSLSIVINEKACVALGKTPAEMVGTAMSYPKVNGYFNYDYEQPQTGQVVGVVKDFPYQSAYQAIDPLVISPRPHAIDRILYVKLPEGKFQEKIALIEKVWKQVYPGVGLDYWFVNDEFERMYVLERRVSALATNFAGLAIFITCVGLFGLASFTTEQKTKEIGIRKALGASNFQILFLLLKLFLQILIVAALIAIPVSYFLSEWWLQNFVYQTPMTWTLFGGSILAITLLTVITVSFESLKASLSDPVKALRYE
ncbi:FtsX-like permease family protein [Fulvivirga sp.]|uniref:ABC transporter permease n=3 Tax=Fulvivirga sp. TaxID=1931237 RepID=UPI0032EC630E